MRSGSLESRILNLISIFLIPISYQFNPLPFGFQEFSLIHMDYYLKVPLPKAVLLIFTASDFLQTLKSESLIKRFIES